VKNRQSFEIPIPIEQTTQHKPGLQCLTLIKNPSLAEGFFTYYWLILINMSESN